MKSIKKQVIEAYDKHYVSSCGEVVDLTLEKVIERVDKWFDDGNVNKKELKLSLKGAEKDEKTK